MKGSDLMEMSEKENAVLTIIPTGSEKPIKGATICAKTGLSKRIMQKTIANLITKHHVKIGAIRKGKETGYYIVQNKADLEMALSPLRAQVKRMEERINILESEK